MVAIPPLTPVTTPPAETVAIVGVALLHTPPGATSIKVIFPATQTLDGPDIVPAAGAVLTVTVAVTVQVPIA